MGGWAEAGFVYNTDDGRQVGLGNTPVAIARDSGLQLNQLYLFLEKDISTNIIPRVTPTPAPMPQDYSAGFHVSAFYGRDSQVVQTFGLDDELHINKPGNEDPDAATANRQSFLTFPQLYASFYMPWGLGMSAMVGNWMSPIGNDIGFHFMPGPNIFYTRSYAFVSAPIKHTGALLAFNLMKGEAGLLSGEAGIVQGWSNFEDNNDSPAYLGALRYRSPDMRLWIDYEFITGDSQADSDKLDGISPTDPEFARRVNIPVTRLISPREQNKT